MTQHALISINRPGIASGGIAATLPGIRGTAGHAKLPESAELGLGAPVPTSPIPAQVANPEKVRHLESRDLAALADLIIDFYLEWKQH